MTKQKKAPAEAQRARAPHGGRFIRDPETGALECVEGTESALGATRDAPAQAGAEPGPEGADTSGDTVSSGPGSSETTVGDDEQHEEGSAEDPTQANLEA